MKALNTEVCITAKKIKSNMGEMMRYDVIMNKQDQFESYTKTQQLAVSLQKNK